MTSERTLDRWSREDLLRLVAEQAATIAVLQAQATALQARVAELEATAARVGTLEEALARTQAQARQPKVKPNRAERGEERPPRKRRAQGASRPRTPPEQVTRVVRHAVAVCTRCGTTLTGGWVQRTREVIEIVPAPVQVTHHQVLARVCPVCQQRCVPRLELRAEVLGQHRVGLHLMALIAHLHTVGRLPGRTIQGYLQEVHGLRLSVGAITEVLAAVARHGAGAVDQLREQVRASPVVCADETSWREDGRHGWCWTFSTPEVRYFEYRPTRGKVVVEELLGGDGTEEAFSGVLVSDCYAAYAAYEGLHARCWAHLLRDADALLQQHPTEPAVSQWVERLRVLFRLAVRWTQRHPTATTLVREAAAAQFTARLHRLCQPHVGRDVPHRTLCERLVRTEADWFRFVADPQVPTTNNLAERALRPQVIARKVSGGTRSRRGSAAYFRLASLFATWRAQEHSPLAACRSLLQAPPL